MPTLHSFAIKNIKRKPVRSWILISAIALLVASLVFAFSFVKRVSGSIKRASERLGADVIIVPTGSRGAAEEVLLENQIKSFYMDGSILDKIRKIDGVEAVTDQTYLVTLTTTCCSVPEAMVVAFNQDTDFVIKPWLTEKLKRRLLKGEAIAGSESAYNIRLGLVNVDSKLFGNVFRLVGALDKTGTGLDTAVFIGRENLDDIIQSGTANIKRGQVSIVFAKVRQGSDPNAVARNIENTIIEVDAVARKDIGKSIINTLRDMRRIFTLSIVLASVLALFLVWSIFSAIANERSREVGIMRALGAKEFHIVKLFFFEVMVIASAGGLIGAALGTAVSVVLGNTFSILRSMSTDLNVLERLVVAVTSFAAGAGICVAGALSPIQRIKKLEPLVVMKAE